MIGINSLLNVGGCCTGLGTMPTMMLLAALAFPAARAFLPAQNPPWPPAWGMRSSTIAMVCNSSGYTNASFASQLGIVRGIGYRETWPQLQRDYYSAAARHLL